MGLPTRIDLGPDNMVLSSYLPDGTLMARGFHSMRTRTIVRVNSDGDTIIRTRRESVVDRKLYRGDWEISGSGTVWRLNTPEGIATVVRNASTTAAQAAAATVAGAAPLSGTATAASEINSNSTATTQAATGRTFTHLWYVRDRLGCVRTVVDDDGTILQCTMFYPSGLPVQLFGTERVTDRAHIGNRWINFAGLGQHDNIARWHDAILSRFTTPDPKAADYPSFSPYTHCAANPLRFTDPTGMDIYSLNSDGTFVLTMKTDDNFDTIVAENGKSIGVSKTFFSSEVSGTDEMEDLDVESGTTSLKDFKYNYYELSGNGMELFEFLANNTNVEWSRLEFSDGNTIIGNSHIEGKDGTCEVFMRNNPERKKLIQAFDHTHPSTDEQSKEDVNLVKSIESFAPKATFRVFYSKDFKLFHKYNGNSKGVDLDHPIEMPPCEIVGQRK